MHIDVAKTSRVTHQNLWAILLVRITQTEVVKEDDLIVLAQDEIHYWLFIGSTTRKKIYLFVKILN